MKLLSLFLFFLFPVITVSHAQSDFIGVSFGGSNLHILDEHATPLIYRGTVILPSLSYDHCSGTSSHTIFGSFHHGFLFAGAENFKTEVIGWDFSYTYLHKIATMHGGFSFDAGGSVSSFFNKSDYSFDVVTFWAKNIESWYGRHSVDLCAGIHNNFNSRNYIEATLNMPLVSNIGRPAYSASGDYNYEENDWDISCFGNTSFFPMNFSVKTQVSYSMMISERFFAVADYIFFYSRSIEPQQIRLYSNNFIIGVGYAF